MLCACEPLVSTSMVIYCYNITGCTGLAIASFLNNFLEVPFDTQCLNSPADSFQSQQCDAGKQELCLQARLLKNATKQFEKSVLKL